MDGTFGTGKMTRLLVAVGRTALTNYLLQTILCTILFYGHGFGWFGFVDRVGQVGVVAAVWTVHLVASPLWLRRFRFGPSIAEWAWRSLTYGSCACRFARHLGGRDGGFDYVELAARYF